MIRAAKSLPRYLRFQNYFKVFFITGILVFTSGCSEDDEPILPNLGKCIAVETIPALQVNGAGDGQTYLYTTPSGAQISIDFNQEIMVTDPGYPLFYLAFWGKTPDDILIAQEETFLGKHIKKWTQLRRSLIFPDGTKLTMITKPNNRGLKSVTIFQGQSLVHINAECNVIEFASADTPEVDAFDRSQLDGETASYEYDAEQITYFNLYTEKKRGRKNGPRVDLARNMAANPNNVVDFYDDPNYVHTRLKAN